MNGDLKDTDELGLVHNILVILVLYLSIELGYLLGKLLDGITGRPSTDIQRDSGVLGLVLLSCGSPRKSYCVCGLWFETVRRNNL